MPGQLAELVERLEALPGQGRDDHDALFWKLQEGELAGSDPNLLSRLLLSLLKRSKKVEPWELSLLRATIKRLKDESANGNLVRELVEKYLEFGGQGHEELL